jgi:hypothetical protein
MILTKDGREPEAVQKEGSKVLEILRKWKKQQETGLVLEDSKFFHFSHPDFPGWRFSHDGVTFYYDHSVENLSHRTTYSAHYQDGLAGKEPYFVPTVCIWGCSGDEKIGGFVRHRANECGWCGNEIDESWTYGPQCPYCGGC